MDIRSGNSTPQTGGTSTTLTLHRSVVRTTNVTLMASENHIFEDEAPEFDFDESDDEIKQIFENQEFVDAVDTPQKTPLSAYSSSLEQFTSSVTQEDRIDTPYVCESPGIDIPRTPGRHSSSDGPEVNYPPSPWTPPYNPPKTPELYNEEDFVIPQTPGKWMSYSSDEEDEGLSNQPSTSEGYTGSSSLHRPLTFDSANSTPRYPTSEGGNDGDDEEDFEDLSLAVEIVQSTD